MTFPVSYSGHHLPCPERKEVCTASHHPAQWSLAVSFHVHGLMRESPLYVIILKEKVVSRSVYGSRLPERRDIYLYRSHAACFIDVYILKSEFIFCSRARDSISAPSVCRHCSPCSPAGPRSRSQEDTTYVAMPTPLIDWRRIAGISGSS